MKKREIQAAMDEICRRLKPFPKFPEAFGPIDGPNYLKINTREAAIAEADRVHAKVMARKAK